MNDAWFALWTRSRHEQVVREQLERKRIEAFLPTVTRWSVSGAWRSSNPCSSTFRPVCAIPSSQTLNASSASLRK